MVAFDLGIHFALTVADNGQGIVDSKQDVIFLPGIQGPDAIKSTVLVCEWCNNWLNGKEVELV